MIDSYSASSNRHHTNAHTQRHRSSQSIQRRSAFNRSPPPLLCDLCRCSCIRSYRRIEQQWEGEAEDRVRRLLQWRRSGGGQAGQSRSPTDAAHRRDAESPIQRSLSALSVLLTHSSALIQRQVWTTAADRAGTTQCESHAHPTTLSDPI